MKKSKNSVSVMEIVPAVMGPVGNETLIELGLATVETARRSLLPAAIPVYGRTGKQVCTVQHFTGSMTARDIKAQYKASGLKGKELQRKVQETLRGESSVRNVMGMAWTQSMLEKGFTVDCGKERKNTGELRLVKVKPPVAAPVEKQVVTQNWEQALKGFGLSDAEIDAVKAQALAVK